MNINSEHKVKIFNRYPTRRLKSTGFTAAISESVIPKRNYSEKAPAHIAQQHKEMWPNVCELCDRAYKRLCDLIDHRHMSHQDIACNICDRTFNSTRSLRVHITKEHTELKPYTCNNCVMIFNSMESLKSHQNEGHIDRHLAIYREERRYSCNQCDKMFKKNSALHYHIKRIHTEARPYPCSQCDKAFKLPYMLKIHQQEHTTCVICGKELRHKAGLLKHIKTSHINEPWPKLILNRIQKLK